MQTSKLNLLLYKIKKISTGYKEDVYKNNKVRIEQLPKYERKGTSI